MVEGQNPFQSELQKRNLALRYYQTQRTAIEFYNLIRAIITNYLPKNKHSFVTEEITSLSFSSLPSEILLLIVPRFTFSDASMLA